MLVDLLDNVMKEINNAEDLKLIAEKLWRKFDELVVKVESELRTKNFSVHDVKRFINRKLHSIRPEEEQLLEHYRQKLHGIQDMDSLFDDFLLKYYFISYLNYVLLKDICKRANITSLFGELRENCIIITYAVFPSVLSDVLEYLKSSAVQQKFQEMGVSVELPEDLG